MFQVEVLLDEGAGGLAETGAEFRVAFERVERLEELLVRAAFHGERDIRPRELAELREIGEDDRLAAGIGFDDDERDVELALHVGDREDDRVGEVVEGRHVVARVGEGDFREEVGGIERLDDLLLLSAVGIGLHAAAEDEPEVRIRVGVEVVHEGLDEEVGRAEPHVFAVVHDDEIALGEMELLEEDRVLLRRLVEVEIDARVDAFHASDAEALEPLLRPVGVGDDLVGEEETLQLTLRIEVAPECGDGLDGLAFGRADEVLEDERVPSRGREEVVGHVEIAAVIEEIPDELELRAEAECGGREEWLLRDRIGKAGEFFSGGEHRELGTGDGFGEEIREILGRLIPRRHDRPGREKHFFH